MAQLTRLSAPFATIHPAVFLALGVGWLVIPTALGITSARVLFGLVFVLNLIPALWVHGVYSLSVLESDQKARWQPLFVATEFLSLLVGISFFTDPLVEQIFVSEKFFQIMPVRLSYLFFGAQLFSMWIAARAFVLVPRDADAPRWLHSKWGVFCCLFATQIGVWLLRPYVRGRKQAP